MIKTYPVDPIRIFRVYEEASGIYITPSVENVSQFYDSTIMGRIDELYYQQNGGRMIGNNSVNPWRDFDRLPTDLRDDIENTLDMKLYLSNQQLSEIFDDFHMFYEDLYDGMKNYPVKEVW